MKKLIVAASALMITGAMASAAVAAPGVSFTGDAYTRYYYLDNFTFGDGDDEADSWRSRVRLRVKGETASGAFAATRFEMDNDRWGTGDGGDVGVEYAYISVPFGCVNLVAGDFDFNSGFMSWHNDTDVEAVELTWAGENATVKAMYAILNTDIPSREREDRIWALVGHYTVAEWKLMAAVSVDNFDISGNQPAAGTIDEENSGFTAAIGAAGQAGPVALHVELGFQEDGFDATDESAVFANDDDGYGGFVSAGMDFGAVGATLIGGFSVDGYTHDAPVGFIMIGGDSMLSPWATIGAGFGPFATDLGTADDPNVFNAALDQWVIGVKTTYQATEALGLGFNLAYTDIEAADVDGASQDPDGDAFEISGSLSYALADGVSVTSNIGYLAVDIDDADPTDGDYDEDIFGAVVSLNLKF